MQYEYDIEVVVSIGLHRKPCISRDQNIILCSTSVHSVIYTMICCASACSYTREQNGGGGVYVAVSHFR